MTTFNQPCARQGWQIRSKLTELSRETSLVLGIPIRFLWIDGDHTYDGAKLDFDLFSPFLVEGAIIAFHDTLHEFEGPIRILVEGALRSGGKDQRHKA